MYRDAEGNIRKEKKQVTPVYRELHSIQYKLMEKRAGARYAAFYVKSVQANIGEILLSILYNIDDIPLIHYCFNLGINEIEDYLLLLRLIVDGSTIPFLLKNEKKDEKKDENKYEYTYVRLLDYCINHKKIDMNDHVNELYTYGYSLKLVESIQQKYKIDICKDDKLITMLIKNIFEKNPWNRFICIKQIEWLCGISNNKYILKKPSKWIDDIINYSTESDIKSDIKSDISTIKQLYIIPILGNFLGDNSFTAILIIH